MLVSIFSASSNFPVCSKKGTTPRDSGSNLLTDKLYPACIAQIASLSHFLDAIHFAKSCKYVYQCILQSQLSTSITFVYDSVFLRFIGNMNAVREEVCYERFMVQRPALRRGCKAGKSISLSNVKGFDISNQRLPIRNSINPALEIRRFQSVLSLQTRQHVINISLEALSKADFRSIEGTNPFMKHGVMSGGEPRRWTPEFSAIWGEKARIYRGKEQEECRTVSVSQSIEDLRFIEYDEIFSLMAFITSSQIKIIDVKTLYCKSIKHHAKGKIHFLNSKQLAIIQDRFCDSRESSAGEKILEKNVGKVLSIWDWRENKPPMPFSLSLIHKGRSSSQLSFTGTRVLEHEDMIIAVAQSEHSLDELRILVWSKKQPSMPFIDHRICVPLTGDARCTFQRIALLQVSQGLLWVGVVGVVGVVAGSELKDKEISWVKGSLWGFRASSLHTRTALTVAHQFTDLLWGAQSSHPTGMALIDEQLVTAFVSEDKPQIRFFNFALGRTEDSSAVDIGDM